MNDMRDEYESTDGEPQELAPLRAIERELTLATHPDDGAHLRAGEVETWAIARQSHEGHEIVARLDSGAGHGHARLSLLVEMDGQRIAHEYVDASTLVELWVNSVVDDEISRRRGELDERVDPNDPELD